MFQLNDVEFSEANFVCNNINIYLKPDEVVGLTELTGSSLTALLKIIRKRGYIDYRAYSSKRKRYENPDYKCPKCGMTVGINEEDHELRYCSAIYLGTPIPTRDFEYSASKFKRIRRCALYDYPP